MVPSLDYKFHRVGTVFMANTWHSDQRINTCWMVIWMTRWQSKVLIHSEVIISGLKTAKSHQQSKMFSCKVKWSLECHSILSFLLCSLVSSCWLPKRKWGMARMKRKRAGRGCAWLGSWMGKREWDGGGKLVCPNKFTGVFQNEKELGNLRSKHGSDYRWKKSLNPKWVALLI